IVDNDEDAINAASSATGATVKDYTAGPIYFQNNSAGSHEWIIEFEKQPADVKVFCDTLDKTLREVNSDYDAKRFNNLALREPIIHIAKEGTFYHWMKRRGKLGGQNKVPRMANDRTFLEEILTMMKDRPD